MFNVGDYIVYPMHGAGTIDAIEEKDIFITLIKRPIENYIKKKYEEKNKRMKGE